MRDKEHKLKREFQGVWIPKELWVTKDLSLVEKALFTEIYYLDGKDGCYASRKHLAKFLNKSEVSVTRAISNLKKVGLITEKEGGFDGRYRVLHAHPENIKKLEVISEPNQKRSGRINKNDEYSNRVSNKSLLGNKDDIKTSPKFKGSLKTPSKEKTNKYLDYWNTLNNVRKHTSPNKSVYKEAVVKLRVFETGKLSKYKLDMNWLKRCEIPERYINKQWNEKRILSGLAMLSQMFTEGYWPEDKKWIPKNLSELIYNPRTQKSWLLYVLINGVSELSDVENRNKKKRFPDLDNLVMILSKALNEARNSDKLQTNEYRILEQTIKKMFEVWQDKKERLEEYLPTFEAFVIDYANWITSRYSGNDKLIASWFKYAGYKWEGYAVVVFEDIGINI